MHCVKSVKFMYPSGIHWIVYFPERESLHSLGNPPLFKVTRESCGFAQPVTKLADILGCLLPQLVQVYPPSVTTSIGPLSDSQLVYPLPEGVSRA